VISPMSQFNAFAERPQGMRDAYPSFAKFRRQTEAELLDFFERRAFDYVSSGAIEYAETLLRARPQLVVDEWVQWFDALGRQVVLRPDMTPSIARMAAPVIQSGKLPIRWCYAERVYRRTATPASLSWASGKAAESTQVGVECIGITGTECDADMLELSHQALDHLKITGAQLVVSHAALMPALLSAFGVTGGAQIELLNDLRRGDYVAFEQHSKRYPAAEQALLAVKVITPYEPSSFQAVLKYPWPDVVAGDVATRAWAELVDLAQCLVTRHLDAVVSFDVTLQREVSYYTGIIFEGFAPGVGAPIVEGGRYDELLAQFGSGAPAIGCAVEVERVMAVLSYQMGGGDVF
jgi:ATP phosphoribosyltransferase regulatory subunit